MVEEQSKPARRRGAIRQHIDRSLKACVRELISEESPVIDAVEYAVFPGGGRLRPALVLAIASDMGFAQLPIIADLANAVEFMHCASLVHDDLPCFDDADLRRGRPSLHCRFDEPTAVLVGDALIIAAHECLTRTGGDRPEHGLTPVRLRALAELAARSGARSGLIAGQAYETRSDVLRQHGLRAYHRAKTAALFEFASVTPAMVASHMGRTQDIDTWREFAQTVGEAYQIADDLLDIVESSGDDSGKPTGQDLRHGRPSAIVEYGTAGARKQLAATLARASSLARQLGAGRATWTWLNELAAAMERQLQLGSALLPVQSWRRGGAGSVMVSEAVPSHHAKNY